MWGGSQTGCPCHDLSLSRQNCMPVAGCSHSESNWKRSCLFYRSNRVALPTSASWKLISRAHFGFSTDIWSIFVNTAIVPFIMVSSVLPLKLKTPSQLLLAGRQPQTGSITVHHHHHLTCSVNFLCIGMGCCIVKEMHQGLCPSTPCSAGMLIHSMNVAWCHPKAP